MSATATIRLSNTLLKEAKVQGRVEHRKPSQQIEYWANVAQCVIDNPELSFSEVHEILIGLEEANAGLITEFHFE